MPDFGKYIVEIVRSGPATADMSVPVAITANVPRTSARVATDTTSLPPTNAKVASSKRRQSNADPFGAHHPRHIMPTQATQVNVISTTMGQDGPSSPALARAATFCRSILSTVDYQRSVDCERGCEDYRKDGKSHVRLCFSEPSCTFCWLRRLAPAAYPPVFFSSSDKRQSCQTTDEFQHSGYHNSKNGAFCYK